jgi:glycosyltransferase involved in cell wall biosynthesis
LAKKNPQQKLVILNQAANYLTVGFANAFLNRFDEVVLVAGSIHIQGEELNSNIKWEKINQWHESPAKKKFLSYLIALIRMWWLLMTKYRKHEVFFVSVPPMGYLLNLLLPHKFSMVIWDIYPDVFKITGMKESHFIYRAWSRLNKKSFNKAYKLFTIGDVMATLLEKYVSRDKINVQPIWAIFRDSEKIPKARNKFIDKHNLENKFIVQYSGNIGLTHNVEVLVEIAEILKNDETILFQIIGRGPRKKYLKELVEEKDLPNCMFLPFQSDEMFPYSISAADIGVVILDETTSKGSVPSKSYNLMSLGIPSLYIASKDSQLSIYAEKFKHAQFFTKENLKEAASWIVEMSKNVEKRKFYSQNSKKASTFFTRENADKFVQQYLS